ncbi:unnamed protein product [Rotaria sp. Silwood1]|nr:unnamed protein product [Rotaria sp. Silwood1]
MDSSETRTPCKYGKNCCRKNPFHFKKHPHPNELQDSNDEYISNNEQYYLIERTPCRYGEDCYNTNPSHLKEYSHPHELLDSDDEYTSNDEQYSSIGRIPCRYGEDCYNTNSSHLKEYSHPHKPQDANDKCKSNDAQSPLAKQTPCRYGKDCYNTKPSHLKEYSHPHELLDSDDEYTSNDEQYSSIGRFPCRYGEDCYNTNLSHLKEYSHPHKTQDTNDTCKSNDAQSTSAKQTPCRYGKDCYDKDPSHLKEYSHPHKTQDANDKCKSNDAQSSSAKQTPCRYGKDCYNKDPSHLREFSHPHNDVQSEMHQNILRTKHHTPIYWGKKAFTESYHEINVNAGSTEFEIISDLLNGTIEHHGNKYGTIYGQDPGQFVVTSITRIHNKTLWEEYCFKKERIIEANGHKLATCESSKYLQGRPLLMPLLDTSANEYWLFHGCDPKTLPTLLKKGYDCRVSSVDGMFGGGFYLAENSSKSNQYIPCPSCQQNCIDRDSNCKCQNQQDFQFSIIFYRTVLGDMHIVKEYKSEIYCGTDVSHPVRRPPKKPNSDDLYDSIIGECNKYGGNSLRYREFVVYDTAQAYPEYVIKYKRSTEKLRSPSNINSVKDRYYTFIKTNSS